MTQLVTTKEAASILGMAEQTLRDWKCCGRVGLPWVEVGGAIRYRLSDLERFIERNTRQHQHPGGRAA